MTDYRSDDWEDGAYPHPDSPAARSMRITTLDEAWALLDKTVREKMPYRGFGVMADGPGYRAWVGTEEHAVQAWSVDDPELVSDPDSPSSAAKAILKLIKMIDP